MNRRQFLSASATGAAFAICSPALVAAEQATLAPQTPLLNKATTADWLARWEQRIKADAQRRYCDTETGEELGWLVSPFLNGFYHGYNATGDERWIDRLHDWAEACLNRSVKEPDGFMGWPKGDGGGGKSDEYGADSLLGEAMLLKPIVLMAGVILKDKALTEKKGEAARRHLKFAGEIFKKWDSRGCWRTTKAGGVWVVPSFGIDLKSGAWSAGYATRLETGFSNPANKQNHISSWLLAMHDVTGEAIYLERAKLWFQEMRSRMREAGESKRWVWNYWDPAGPWDYKPGGLTKHWVGVHPNGGYYGIDVDAMVEAFEHGLVFYRADIDKLIATNRDFMWNQKLEGSSFQRIDGGVTDPRWLKSPGVLWTKLVPYDDTLRSIFIANHDPASWGGIAGTPWYLALSRQSIDKSK